MIRPVMALEALEPDAAPAPRLRVWLLGLAAVCVAGGVALAAGLSLHRAAHEQTAIETSAVAAARNLSQAADREIGMAVARLQALATSPALRAGDARAFYDQLLATPKPDDTWFVLSSTEAQLLNTLRPFNTGPLPRIADFDQASQEAARRMFATREIAVTPVIWGPAAQAYVVGVTLPVVLDDRVTYLFSQVLSERRIGQVIDDQQLDLRWRAALIDRYGATVALAHGQSRPPGPGVPEAWLGWLRGADAQGVFAAERGGTPLLVAFARSPSSDWTAVVEIPYGIVAAPIRTTVNLLLAGGLVLVLAGCAVAWLLAGRADRPFEALRTSALTARSGQRQAEAQYQTYWQHAHEALFALRVTPEGRFVFEGINPAFERASGLNQASVIGREPRDCLPRDAAERLNERCRECVAGGSATFDESLALPAGRREWQTSLVPLRGAGQDSVVRILGSTRDVTDRRQFEAALRGLGSKLLTLQDDERRKIARELHDSTAQILVGASFAVARARAVSPGMTGEGDDAIEDALSLIEESQREIRSVAYLLHPPLLDEMGLPAALRWFAKGFALRSGLALMVEVAPELEGRRLPADVESAFFRISQEAIGNAYRHSGGTEVRIALRWATERDPAGHGRAVVLTVRDDGRGIATPPSPPGESALFGVGLVGMRERMLQLGGRLTVGPAEQGGTVVQAVVAVAAEPPTPAPVRAGALDSA
ncbi:PAS domain-containing protein [Falsiroseomonas sp. HW251]|uniref:sensor histidine kinase n=1 Tax=Falsiroseomonas sp. HW251 TaxID=3390998 RepID=UPI003D31A8B3